MAATRSSRGSPSLVRGTGEIFQKKWPRLFMLTAIVQAAICIAFEG